MHYKNKILEPFNATLALEFKINKHFQKIALKLQIFLKIIQIKKVL